MVTRLNKLKYKYRCYSIEEVIERLLAILTKVDLANEMKEDKDDNSDDKSDDGSDDSSDEDSDDYQDEDDEDDRNEPPPRIVYPFLPR